MKQNLHCMWTFGVLKQVTTLDIAMVCATYVTQPWEIVPNCTSGKIKLTPPAYSHTTVLLISSLNFSLHN